MDQYTEKEAAVVGQLRHFRPHPGQHAYQRMAGAPWAGPVGKQPVINIGSLSQPVRFTAMTVLIVVIASTLVWLTPSLRSFAQELLNGLFNRASSDTITVESPGAFTEEAVVLMDISQVEALAGFDIKEPQSIPSGYTFTGAGYTESRQAVSLLYQYPGAELIITQQPVEYAEYGLLTDGGSGIGPDAPIENVQIGDVTGEYVVGTWIMISDNQAVWQTHVPLQRLRWQEGGLIYEILVVGGSSDSGSGIDLNAMIVIAISLQ